MLGNLRVDLLYLTFWNEFKDCGCRSPGIPGIGTGPLLFVVRHTGTSYYELRANNWPYSRVSIYCAVSGAGIKEISCSLFRTANAIALA